MLLQAIHQHYSIKLFIPDKGKGEWTEVIETEWGYQNMYNKDYECSITGNTDQLVFNNTDGDWMTIGNIKIISPMDTIILYPAISDWGTSQKDTLVIDNSGKVTNTHGETIGFPLIDKWIKFASSENIKIMVGEFGVYRFTPRMLP
ncbi:MAG: hypothetical protein HC906_15440 [Bacteroidales bacterium]|nr:hypothetical protein [Bacteroidales bacterium]